MKCRFTQQQMQDAANAKFTRLIEDEALDDYTSDELTILFAMLAEKSAQYAADAIDW